MARGVRHDRDSRIVGDVQPLVRVHGPGVGLRNAAQEVKERRRGRPQPERAIHVQPGTVTVRDLGDLIQGIEGAGADVAGLSADERGSAPLA